jgi:hypothetical protein
MRVSNDWVSRIDWLLYSYMMHYSSKDRPRLTAINSCEFDLVDVRNEEQLAVIWARSESVFWNIQSINCLPAEGIDSVDNSAGRLGGISNPVLFCAKRLWTRKKCFVTRQSIKRVYLPETE